MARIGINAMQELHQKETIPDKFVFFFSKIGKANKMVREPNVSPHKQIIKDDDVEENISTE